jgi:DNA-binding transcriptional ArsR family regulator
VTRDPDDVFEALADPTRRAVIRALAEEGPSTLSELSSRLPVTRQAVSKHLTLLQEAGLVATQGSESRGRRYAFTPAPLTAAMGWMVDVGADWDARLARLKRLVEDPTRPA